MFIYLKLTIICKLPFYIAIMKFSASHWYYILHELVSIYIHDHLFTIFNFTSLNFCTFVYMHGICLKARNILVFLTENVITVLYLLTHSNSYVFHLVLKWLLVNSEHTLHTFNFKYPGFHVSSHGLKGIQEFECKVAVHNWNSNMKI